MRTTFCVGSILLFTACLGTETHSQTIAKKAPSLGQLELAAEVAATTDQGYPSALRVTLKNVGNRTVTMPVLGGDCHPNNGVRIESFWMSVDEQSGMGGGGGCGITDQPSLLERARKRWIRLAPGEFITTTLQLDPRSKDEGTIEYWVEYTPPDATAQELEELLQAGFIIPTEKLATDHRSFMIH